MSALFLKILNLTINASWLILAVIAARLLLKKAPRWISCLLWGLVAVRLLCPISLESVLSILPSAKVVPENIEMVQDPHIDSGVRIIDNAVNPVIEKSFSPDAVSSVNPMQVVVFMGSILWLTGMTVMLLYALISYILLRRKVRASVAMYDRVKECDEVDSPFILGIFRPEIYVPSGIDENTLELVIAHEEAHLKRHDHWWKPFGFGLLAIYWFNPLCWVAYVLLCRFSFFSYVSIFVITSFAKSSMLTPKRKQIFFNIFKSGSLTSLSQFDSACRVTFNSPASSSCVIPDCVRR